MSAGTGHPHTLRCAKCKIGRDWNDLHQMARGCQLEATGRTRKRYRGGGPRTAKRLIEYRCRAVVGIMNRAEVELVVGGLESIAKSISGLATAVILLGAAVEKFPLRSVAAGVLTSTEALKQLSELDNAMALIIKSRDCL